VKFLELPHWTGWTSLACQLAPARTGSQLHHRPSSRCSTKLLRTRKEICNSLGTHQVLA